MQKSALIYGLVSFLFSFNSFFVKAPKDEEPENGDLKTKRKKNTVKTEDEHGKAILRKPKTMVLKTENPEKNVSRVVRAFLEEENKGRFRLEVTHQKKMPRQYFYTLSGLVLYDLLINKHFNKGVSMIDTPNGLRFIWSPNLIEDE